MSYDKQQRAQAKRLKNTAEGFRLLARAAQLLGFNIATNYKIYSDEPTVGYVLGSPAYTEYVTELQKRDLEKGEE